MKCFCNKNQFTNKIEDTITFLKVLSDQNRLKIVCYLKEKERCVCEIVKFLDIPQNLVSHHLKTLRENKIVSNRKEGLNVYYSLNVKDVSTMVEFFNSLTIKSCKK